MADNDYVYAMVDMSRKRKDRAKREKENKGDRAKQERENQGDRAKQERENQADRAKQERENQADRAKQERENQGDRAKQERENQGDRAKQERENQEDRAKQERENQEDRAKQERENQGDRAKRERENGKTQSLDKKITITDELVSVEPAISKPIMKNLNKKQARKPMIFCALAIALAFIALAIILLACISLLFTEIGKLDLRIAAQERLSEESMSLVSSTQLSMLRQEFESNISDIEIRVLHRLSEMHDLNFIRLEKRVEQQENLTSRIDLLFDNQNNSIHLAFLNITQIQELVQQMNQTIDSFDQKLLDFENRNYASSCAALPPSSPSGYYLIRASNGSAVRVYCDMTRTCGNITGGWMRAVEINASRCPSGFSMYRDDQIRTCRTDESANGCFSAPLDMPIHYSKVCGKIIAYQVGDTDAFNDGLNNISSIYVDGISLTRGNPREHIWTFAAARDETSNVFLRSKCSCITNGTSHPPTFVGNDYFCDTGSNVVDVPAHAFFSDPLWDGAGCGTGNSCCNFNNPPWFYRELPQLVPLDMEMRVCRSQFARFGDIAIEKIEILIQ